MRGLRGTQVSLRSQAQKEFNRYEFRNYRCTGSSCSFEMDAIANLDITCPTAGCKGSVTSRRKISPQTMVRDSLDYFGYP
ncbi:hypothetical protein N9D40_00965 [bacterium]|nr:hypothetical protein [bacterium]